MGDPEDGEEERPGQPCEVDRGTIRVHEEVADRALLMAHEQDRPEDDAGDERGERGEDDEEPEDVATQQVEDGGDGHEHERGHRGDEVRGRIQAMRALLAAAGFRIIAEQDSTEEGQAWFEAVAARIAAGEASRGVAHVTSGPALQQNMVCVLEGE